MVAIGLAVAGLVFFRDYHESAMDHLSDGIFTSEQVFGLFGAALLMVASIGTLVAFPQQLSVETEGLLSVRGVFATLRRLRPKASIQTLTVHTRHLRSNNLQVTVHDVWIEGTGGRQRIRRFPSAERAEAEALVAHCAELWDAKVQPYV